jgi:hypothetical protein
VISQSDRASRAKRHETCRTPKVSRKQMRFVGSHTVPWIAAVLRRFRKQSLPRNHVVRLGTSSWISINVVPVRS